MTDQPVATRSEEWRRGWAFVLSAAAGLSLSPVPLYTMGLFVEPLEAEFGWSRTAISAGITINAIVALVFAPFVGTIVDRLGPRRVGLSGAVSFCGVFALFATNAGSLTQWWLLWLMLSFTTLAVKTTVWVAAVTSRFEKARGMAIALTMCGSSMTAMISPLIVAPVIAGYGWRMAYVAVAVVWGIAVVPLLLAFFFGRSDLARSKGGSGATAAEGRAALTGWDVKPALRSWNYAKIVIACVISYFAISGAMVNLVPILSGRGVDLKTAALLASFVGVGSLVGRLVSGYCLDRFSAERLAAILFGLPTIAFVLLLGGSSSFPLMACVALTLGVATGAEIEVASYLVARYFGLRNFGLLFSVVAGLLGAASGISPVAFSFIFDRFNSYQNLLFFVLPLPICASILMLTLDRRASRQAAAEPA